MSTKEIPRCWCKRPINLSCIRADHLIPCKACGSSMAVGERGAPLAPGAKVKCKSCHAGHSIFGWDHESAMAWLDANKNHLRHVNGGKTNGQIESLSSKSSQDAGALLKMSDEGLSPEKLRARAIDVLEGMKPMHAELLQALRCIQSPNKVPGPNFLSRDPMRFPRILEAVLLLHGDVPEGESELGKAFETVKELLVSQNPLASAVSALARIKRQCDKVKAALREKEIQPEGCSVLPPCLTEEPSVADSVSVFEQVFFFR
ncbi:uncharacterized protein BDV17DRAFT_296132 [Aspergillus undulatus]|uniref:uncharacterized protein n=1 Tax=Aspergillus undulatus TaxID=1810928 RepID=UPI003CCE03EA